MDSGQSPLDLLPDLHRLRSKIRTLLKDPGNMFIDNVIGDPIWPRIFARISRRIYLDRPVAIPSPGFADPPNIVQ